MAMSVSELIGKIIYPRPAVSKTPPAATVSLTEQRLDVLLHRTISAPLQAAVSVEALSAYPPVAEPAPPRVSAAD